MKIPDFWAFLEGEERILVIPDNGKTVLAFRGTDNLDASNILSSDIWNGWTIGAGFNTASQAKLAQDFYTSQTGLSLFGEASSDVILTGHSLGGGLAGYLSALNGTKAYGFDHMTFGPAAEATVVAYLKSLGVTDPTEQDYATYGLRLPDANQFIGTHVEGEVLEGVRSGAYAMTGAAITGMYSLLPANFLTSYAMGATWLLAKMGLAEQAYESSVNNSMLQTFGWDPGGELLSGTPRHSQALLVILQYAKEQEGLGDWSSSGFAVPLLNALYKDGIATSVGIVKDGPSDLDDDFASGTWVPHDLMMSKIAYSVLDSGNRPFGDSAVRSLFNDAEAVGAFLNAGGNSLLDVAGVADRIVRFAGFQAHHSVIGQHDGFVSLDGRLLGFDYRDQTWMFGGESGIGLNVGTDYSSYLADGSLSSIEKVVLDLGPGRFEYEFYSNAVGGWQGQIGFESALHTVKAVGTDTLDTIIGTDGDEQILLGGGNDQVKANGGVNWIDGGDGDDKLIDDNAWADFEITLQNGRYYFALRESGTDPRIHVLDNMELFRLGGEDFDAANILNVAPTDVYISSFVGDAGSDGFLPGSVAAGTEIANLCAVDGNEHDRFTWEVLGTGANFYTIENGVLKASVAFTYSYLYWYAQVGAVTYSEWQADDLTPGFANLLGTQYGITVRATDAAGVSTEQDVFLFLENHLNTVIGTPQNDTLVGGAGQSLIAGLGGADTISDNDWLVLDYSASNASVRLARTSATDRVFEGYGGHAQGDLVTLASTSVRYDIIGSSSRDDILYAYEVFSGGGDDVITGSKIVHAGDGYDTVIVTNNTDFIDFGVGGGELQLANGQVYFVDMAQGIYHRMSGGTVAHALTVIGDYTKITGSNQIDTIYGTAGNDRIYGGGGNDQIWGYGGHDHLEGQGSIWGGLGEDVIVLTGKGTAWGGDDKDTITAKVAESTLYGGAGQDTLTTLAAYSTVVGGADGDTINLYTYNGTASNTLSYFDSPDGITLRTVGNQVYGYGADAEGDIVTGAFKLIGSGHDEDIRLAGFKSMEVKTGAGEDYIEIGMKADIKIWAGADKDEIHLKRLQTAYGEAEDDKLYGVGTMYGGDGNDTFHLDLDFYYNAWAGTIGNGTPTWAGGIVYGGIGNNTIYGGGGDDTIRLEEGADTFIFQTGGRKDTVIGAGSDDVIRLDGVLAFSTMSDVVGSLEQVGSNVMLDFRKMSDHKDVYGDDAPNDYIGSIQFNGMTIAQVSALSWEFV